MSKRETRTGVESVEEFLARGGKIQQVPADESSKRSSRRRREDDRYTDARMREAENRGGCYSPYWGEE